MKILSSFTHPHVVPNLYDTNSVEHKRRYFEGCWQPKGVCSIDYEVKVNGNRNCLVTNIFL